ncbi:NAD(P)/FAD-dependent oxidoreductase [Roseivirga sp. E12]|uniref:flavin monoamine oxidase family protein n=1 Tax=Roseivirga sp. E12 TaxID=2819237 RepID=UPI001ABBF701|nr:NAD(P)/FAD-dependent oxidoreductase [Roseivirga sp. E12]MBO3698100.1 FAD-dependent oxidoreductase [Roseivirga sp. E12]
MNRTEFIKKTSAMGLGALLLPSLFTGCEDEFSPIFESNFSGKVLIIGAGAAGLTAGHVLNQQGIDFEIIEASSVYGGRIKEIQGFADFPIDLGGEWIHTKASILSDLLNDNTISDKIEIINYSPETLHVWNNGKLKKRNIFTHFYGELKFKNTTWFSFFDRYIVPGISDKIRLNSPVQSIDYSSDIITVTDTSNTTYTGDRVILTVPLTILKQGSISFTPPLPDSKITALDDVDMPDGIKVFMEFSERFYPDLLYDGGLSAILSDTDGEKIFYDAAFRKGSSKNILGLFAVGKPSSVYANIATDEELITFILAELDNMFGENVSRHYVKHVTQNWSKEPFIGGSYSHYQNEEAISTLAQSVNNKLFFAGEAYHTEETATVHGAGLTAYNVVEELLRNE